MLIKTFLFQAFYIPSDSMVPTLKTNDRVIVNKLSYQLHAGAPRRHRRVQVAAERRSRRSTIWSSASSALPGETVEGRDDGHIYINGKVLKEPYLPKGHDSRDRASPSSRSRPTPTG